MEVRPGEREKRMEEEIICRHLSRPADSRILAFGNIRALVFGLSRQPQVTAANNRPFFYLYAIGGHGKAVSGGLPWVFSFLHLCL
jgi:hypothetical protein